jgi:hypothetical protein
MKAVQLLGWIHAILGGLGLLGGGWICLGLMADPQGGPALYYIGPLFVGLSGLYLLPAFVGGAGIILGKAWGRWLVIALSFVLLLAIPVGTLLGGFGLWALLRKGAIPPAEAAALAQPGIMPTLRAPDPNRMNLLVVIAGAGAAMAIALNAAFWAHGDTPPTELRLAAYPAVMILAAVLAYIVVRRPFAGWGRPAFSDNPVATARSRRRMRRDREAWRAERRARIGMLSADPALRPYAERMAAGESWSDEQIAYDRDPRALATCRHLAPIERALREAGLPMRLHRPPQVRCDCHIDQAALWARFPPGRHLSYVERFLGGRAAEDDPVAYLICDACQASIDVLHPCLGRPSTPRFPAPPT